MASLEMRRIADQLDRAVNGPAWHGPAILELVKGVSAKDAAAKPIPAAHSIWELVVHTAAWLEIVRLRLDGKAPRRITEDMNWPSAGPAKSKGAKGESANREWRTDIDRLRRAERDLQAAIESHDDRRLSETLPGVGDTWSAYITLHGAVQHVLYHAGQIAILKKGKP